MYGAEDNLAVASGERRSRRGAIAWLALMLLLSILSSAEHAAGSPADARVAAIESQVADKKRAIAEIERRNADLQHGIDVNPSNTGANFSARQEIRTNARYVAVYQNELAELERTLASVRELAQGGAEPGATAKRRDRRPAPSAAEPELPPRAVDVTPSANQAPTDVATATLDRTEVRDLMRSWALGQTGVPGMGASASDEAPLTIVLDGLDWSLDWRELLGGLVLGGLAGTAVPGILNRLLRRRLPARAPVVGAMSRKWGSTAGATGSPSKQWLDLDSKATSPARIAAGGATLIAIGLVAQAAASWTGWGPSLGTPGIGGELVLLALALGLGGAAAVLWRKRAFEPAFAAGCALAIACLVPAALGLSPFGGRGAWAWLVILLVGTALELRAATVLWPLTSPRAAVDAARRTAVASAVFGAVAGLAAAALYLVSA